MVGDKQIDGKTNMLVEIVVLMGKRVLPPNANLYIQNSLGGHGKQTD